jgi:hypothetical protein
VPLQKHGGANKKRASGFGERVGMAGEQAGRTALLCIIPVYPKTPTNPNRSTEVGWRLDLASIRKTGCVFIGRYSTSHEKCVNLFAGKNCVNKLISVKIT